MKNRITLMTICLLALSPISTVNGNTLCDENDDIPNSRDNKNESPSDYFSVQYDIESKLLKVTYTGELSNVKVLIYKDDVLADDDEQESTSKGQTCIYPLSLYGSGDFTIYITVDNIIADVRSLTVE